MGPSNESDRAAASEWRDDAWLKIVEAIAPQWAMHKGSVVALEDVRGRKRTRPKTADDEQDYDKVTGTYLSISAGQGFPATQKQVAEALCYAEFSVRRMCRRVGITQWPPC